ncbi:hypothetical protein FRC08_005111 [Ceratobasidium sp. 394]|nr:hypothetical protein FRC08_005111 [Ceratobasidium sp. 394]
MLRVKFLTNTVRDAGDLDLDLDLDLEYDLLGDLDLDLDLDLDAERMRMSPSLPFVMVRWKRFVTPGSS